MNLSIQSRLIHSRRTLLALLALVFATGVCVALLLARAIYARELRFQFLPINLVLAWIPLIFALAVYALRARGSRHWLLLGACAFVWFIFYPNAPYLITDLVHLHTRAPVPHWFDILLFMSFAWTGLFLGYLSLYLMQEVVRNWLGRAFSWQFAIGMLAMGALGVFLGRFWRWNSWEVATHPFGLASDAMRRLSGMRLGEAAAFAATFFAFSALIYATLYTITHLHGHIETREEAASLRNERERGAS
jgi:uncharacterized membrane protein